MDFNCIPLEIQEIIVNLCPFIQTRLVSKNFNKFTQSRYDTAASIIRNKDLKHINMPFAIFRDDFIFNYIDNTGVYGCMGDSLYYYKCKSRCFSLEHCNSSEIEELDFLTTYRVLIQRGCTPRFVKNLIVNRIKQLKIWLYSKSVEQHLYLWLYINAAIMGLTNIDNISNMVYNKEESVILYNKILTFFL